MQSKLRSRMIFHGAIVILIGLLVGFPYTLVILGHMEGEPRAWNMAHLEGVLNGLLVIAVAAILRRLSLDEKKQAVLAWSLILMAYGNVLASTIGALFGVRGLSFAGPLANVVVALLFTLAIVGVVVGMVLVAYGARGDDEVASRVSVEVTREPDGHSPGAPTGSGRRRSRRRRSRSRDTGDGAS